MSCERTIEITDGVYWTGTLNPLLRVFDIIMKTEYGTSYNSYIVKGSSKIALIDGGHEKFTDLFLEKVSGIIEGDFTKIDYVVVNHTEPDHAGNLFKLMELNPEIKIVCTVPAKKFLEQISNRSFNFIQASDELKIDLGGKTLEFLLSPFWHWPDTMFTYLKEDKILFPCDGFGAHFSDERMFVDLLDEDSYKKYLQAMQYYYVHIMGPFKEHTRNTLEKLDRYDIKTIAPSHGPIHTGEFVKKHTDLYRQWAKKDVHKKNRILLLYVSAYGYTRKLAMSIAKGIENAGGEVQLFDLVNDVNAENKLDILVNKQEWADGILYGSPTINGDALLNIWEAIGLLALVDGKKEKSYSAFGSYGWSGEAVPFLFNRLSAMKFDVFSSENPLRIRFKPTEKDLETAEQFGRSFLEHIRGMEK
ncbi:MAG TPA: FprA family A-type flavoprotein [Petrotogaceae bacterium]|jgi:flavorubredoxin|nr:FprA family A-type flavoprotein [Petrotogaceae bacterium]HPO26336.1 FprA family A-type flavoprotein [Petrotogaceae bacterium]HQO12512.1 FprA family A-type flavoprotein [Petrotogaceae bacterium]HQP58305.1 FprA family A-type flavoprotein [Petrotogaceae bacterium]